ncbi:helix-turn-helix transcriptional regulator [Desulfobulbus sp.]|uniref:helix-turn-helix domain-containing protein n=1 Tax=Desulfobulbus sp. TaxID=895 RepID=UPI00286F0A82|nr:helix-turn-helix transcriptional regulator [Desulfobulbus sp.]
MPEAGRTPPIDLRVRVRGKKKAEKLIALLRDEFRAHVEIVEDDDDKLVVATETDWYKQISAEMTPGDTLRIRRENAGLTQAALGEKAGVSRKNISDMENNRRPIGEAVAERLAAAMGLPAGVLQRRW